MQRLAPPCLALFEQSKQALIRISSSAEIIDAL
jgi:hypothetical protein